MNYVLNCDFKTDNIIFESNGDVITLPVKHLVDIYKVVQRYVVEIEDEEE